MADNISLQDILGGGLPAGLLSPEQEAAAQQRAQNAALLNFAFGALQASRGQPGQGKPGLGQIIGQAGPVGMQAYQQSFDQTLANLLRGMQVSEYKRKQDVATALRNITPQLFTEQRTPATQEIIPAETGDIVSTVPGKVTGYNVNMQALPALAALGPEGMEYAKNLASFQDALSPKYSVQTIYSPNGKEQKVRYNERTGEFSPLGGAKAENFVQVDRGNVVELRTPSGDLIGSLSKGAAPTGPSYTMTDAGILNTKTGQLVQARDEQGNPITLDTTAKASEDERKSAGFYLRMADATNTFNKPITDAKGNPIAGKDGKPILLKDAAEKPELIASIVGGIIPNWAGGQAAQNILTTSLRQQYQQAQENWVTANLRPESGAVIGPAEMEKEIRKWFPQIGESDALVRQKEEARKVTEDAIRRRAGRALSVQQRNITVNY